MWGGGRRSSSPNKSQRNSIFYSPTKDQRHCLSCSHSPSKTLPSRGTVHYLFSSSAPSPGAGRFPSANTGAHGWKEKNRSNPPTKLASCFTRPCLRLYIPAHARALHWYFLRGLGLFLLCHHSPSTFNSHGITIGFRNLHSFSQARALRSLQLRWIQQDCTSCITFHPIKLYALNDTNPTWCWCWWSRPTTRASPSSPAA